jgi:hypothetical protein
MSGVDPKPSAASVGFASPTHKNVAAGYNSREYARTPGEKDWAAWKRRYADSF